MWLVDDLRSQYDTVYLSYWIGLAVGGKSGEQMPTGAEVRADFDTRLREVPGGGSDDAKDVLLQGLGLRSSGGV